jgi:RNA polymerase sigma factor (sigma-70 family)
VDSWVALLQAGNSEGAWDALIARYRRLIFASIRRVTNDPDDAMDVFVRVCDTLRADDFRRLRDYTARAAPGTRFSTWLCAVVHNRGIDSVRAREGRPRASAAAQQMAPLQRHIYDRVFLDLRSHVEAYELTRATFPALTFRTFLGALRDVYRLVGREMPVAARTAATSSSETAELDAPPTTDPAVAGEREAVLGAAMGALEPDDRLVVQLYVMEGMSAADVAHVVGLSGAKAVYNRVYRALAALRQRLEQFRIGAGDL